MIDPKTLAGWKQLAESAAPGPWAIDDLDTGAPPDRVYGINDANGQPVVLTEAGFSPPDRKTAEFLVAARIAVPALLAEVERLRRLIPPMVVSAAVVSGTTPTVRLGLSEVEQARREERERCADKLETRAAEMVDDPHITAQGRAAAHELRLCAEDLRRL